MASMWLPGASVIRANSDGGSMLGGPRKVVWHTTENDPNRASAASVARYLKSSGNEVHIVWNPVTGQIIQMIPANRASKGLRNAAGGVQTNRGGTYVIQIEVVGQAAHPFTNTKCVNLGKILAWVKSLGVPATWPAGAPRPYPGSYVRSRAAWAKSGHFGHSQVPENTHGDPGAVNWRKLIAYPGVAPAPAPAPKPVPKPSHPVWDGHVLSTADAGHYRLDAKTWQQQMKNRGWNIVADGFFGPGSSKVAHDFQVEKHLGVDGKVGRETWDAAWTAPR